MVVGRIFEVSCSARIACCRSGGGSISGMGEVSIVDVVSKARRTGCGLGSG